MEQLRYSPVLDGARNFWRPNLVTLEQSFVFVFVRSRPQMKMVSKEQLWKQSANSRRRPS